MPAAAFVAQVVKRPVLQGDLIKVIGECSCGSCCCHFMSVEHAETRPLHRCRACGKYHDMVGAALLAAHHIGRQRAIAESN